MTPPAHDRLAAAGALAAFLAAAGLLQLFVEYDWGMGAVRAGLLVALGALLATLRWWARSSGAPRSWGWAAVAVVVALAAWHVAVGAGSLMRTKATGDLRLDQGENSFRAVRTLLAGRNPYGTRTLLDPTEYRVLVRRWRARPDCVEFAGASRDPFPAISDRPECAEARRDWAGLGYKYGPVTLATYVVPVTALGKAGIFATHLALFAALAVVLWLLALRSAGGDLFLGALPLLLVLLPAHYRLNALDLSAADLAPVLLALTFLALRARPVLAGTALGLSIAAKVLPGALFLPLLLPLGRRAWTALGATLAAAFLPFAVWDLEGLLSNILLYNLRRPTDSTALAHFMSPGAGAALGAAVAGSLVILVVHLRRRGWNARRAMAYLASAHLGVLLAGKIFHNNYLLWLAPVLGLSMLAEVRSGARPAGIQRQDDPAGGDVRPRSRRWIHSPAPPHRPR